MSVTIASGMRLTPARLNPAQCIVTRVASQTITTGGSGTAVSFSAEEIDSNGMWSSGTNVTVQVAGTYDLNGSTIFATGATGVRAINVQVNGTIVAEQKRTNTNQSDPISVSTKARLAVNDVITLVVFHTQGASLGVTVSRLAAVQVGG